MSEFPFMDERQVKGLMPFFEALLLPAYAADPTAPMPPPAVLVTVYEPPEAPTVAWLTDIQVQATLPDGQRLLLGCADLLGCLLTQPALLRRVEPVTPYLAFVLDVPALLRAWDFTPLGVAHADELTTTLLRWGPKPRRKRRSRVFWALPKVEQRQVLHEAVSDYLLEDGRLRIPMRGILHAGWHDFGTGEIRRPSQILRYFEAALRRRRQAEVPESTLTPAAQARYSAQAAPPHPDDIEDYIQDLTASLPPKEQAAVGHRVRAIDRGLTLKTYCAQEGLPYDATRQAALRGRDLIEAAQKKKFSVMSHVPDLAGYPFMKGKNGAAVERRMFVQVLELKDPAAGVLARSYRREDWVQFLDICIARKHEDIDRLDGIDPFGAALITAEIERLRTIRGLLTGAIPYPALDAEDDTDAAADEP